MSLRYHEPIKKRLPLTEDGLKKFKEKSIKMANDCRELSKKLGILIDKNNKKRLNKYLDRRSKMGTCCCTDDREKKEVNLLFQSMECIFITDEIGEKAGLYLKKFHRSHNLQLGDSLIAATAYINNSRLLTFNRKHYPMKDIKVVVPE